VLVIKKGPRACSDRSKRWDVRWLAAAANARAAREMVGYAPLSASGLDEALWRH